MGTSLGMTAYGNEMTCPNSLTLSPWKLLRSIQHNSGHESSWLNRECIPSTSSDFYPRPCVSLIHCSVTKHTKT